MSLDMMKGADLFGYRLANPFGVPASLLTQDAEHIGTWAGEGYGIITYKTVRTQNHPGNMPPHIGYILSNGGDEENIRAFARQGAGLQVTAQEEYFTSAMGNPYSMVNSVGMPSKAPAEWQEDFLEAKARLQMDQLLILSVTGTVGQGASDDDLVADFVWAALLAAQVTPWPIELNLSCPNTGEGLLYQNQPLCERVVREVKKAVTNHKLIGKIGYISPDRLRTLVSVLEPLDGIAAINTVAVPVVGPDTKPDSIAVPFFPGRPTAGLSGRLIRPLAWEVIHNLIELRKQGVHKLTILAMGGVERDEDFESYLDMGADAVQSATMFLLKEAAYRCADSQEEPEGDPVEN